ncbi:MAG: hypothetical protein ABIT01_14915 [Thermoanaerobaculia bacterium]
MRDAPNLATKLAYERYVFTELVGDPLMSSAHGGAHPVRRFRAH